LALKPSSPKPGGGGNQNRPGGNQNRPTGGGPNRPAGGGPNRPASGGPYRPPAGGGQNRPPAGGRRPFPPRQQQAEHRINEHIRVPELRLVGDNLEEISEVTGQKIEPGTVYNTALLRGWAEEMTLDLVEISPNADPPVARIVDYNKFLYQKKKKEKELKANAVKQQLKEIRFGPETGDHDFEFKLRHAKNFLGEGNKVKAYVQFRGRAIVFKDRGELLLLRFLKELEDYGAPEQLPRMDGKRMMVIIAPKKTPGKK
jgi:translation initiation factor IF-3